MATDPGTDKSRPVLGLPGKDKPASPVDGANPGSMASAEAKAEAQAGLEARKRGPYIKSGKYSAKNRDLAGSERPATPSGTAVPAEVQAELDRLFSPEIWEPLVEMPAAIGMVLTGHEHWALSEKERRVGSVSVSTAAKYAGIQSPAKLAFLLATLNLSGIYMPKILAEIKIRAAEKMASRKKPPENVGS
ncbi:MAG: hypothetical protein KGJ13_06390 [Patescibacteria group bacterium]|nr:hypothetical protein [Patescibacteria group bacterium]